MCDKIMFRKRTMNKKKSLHVKSKVVLVVLGFSLFSFGGLLFTFIKSSKIDTEHVVITEITEKVQIDVLLAIIGVDEFYIYRDTSLIRNISNNFKNAEDHNPVTGHNPSIKNKTTNILQRPE